MLNERSLTKAEEKRKEKIVKDLKPNKREFVKRYGKDAESVMYGTAVKRAKKQVKEMNEDRIKEAVKKALMKDEANEELKGGQKKLDADGDGKISSEDFKLLRAKKDMKEAESGTVTVKDPAQAAMLAKQGVNVTLNKEDLNPDYSEYEDENDEFLALTFKNKDEFERAKEHFESKSDFYPENINDEFRSFQFKVEDQADADSTEFYLTQELEGTTNLQGYYFSMEPSSLSEDLDLGHEDDEPHMIKGELYRIGKYAMELYQMVDQFEGEDEVDFPAWWQAKITTAKNMVSSAKHYLEFELKEPEIDAMVGVASSEEIIDDEDSLMEEVNLKASKLSPAEYQKAKKLKDFKASDWKYDSKESLYTKVVKEEIDETDILAAKIAKALQSNKSPEDQNNIKQARKAMNDGNMEAAKKILKPYLEEGLPKGYWAKKIPGGKMDESYEALVKKIKGQGKSEKAAKAIAGAVAAYKAKGGGKGPTAKQKK